MEKTKHKVICPECNGNGFIRVPYEQAREEITARCDTCELQYMMLYLIQQVTG